MDHFNILLATDYSETVKNAERYAVQLAKSVNTTLNFLHVYNTSIPLPYEAFEYSRHDRDSKQTELTNLLEHRDNLFNSLHISRDEIAGNCFVREGSIGDQICKEAEDIQADFILVGTHGVGELRETFLGSNSWSVIRKSSIPVLAIPEDALFTGIKTIVFGTAYREEEFETLEFLVGFAKKFDAHLIILHVTNYILSKQFEKELFEQFRSNVHTRFSYSKLEVRLQVNDSIEDGLNSYCSENKVDLLALSVPKLTLFEKIFLPNSSLARRMSFHTHTPLLAIPDAYHVKQNEDFVYSKDSKLIETDLNSLVYFL